MSPKELNHRLKKLETMTELLRIPIQQPATAAYSDSSYCSEVPYPRYKMVADGWRAREQISQEIEEHRRRGEKIFRESFKVAESPYEILERIRQHEERRKEAAMEEYRRDMINRTRDNLKWQGHKLATAVVDFSDESVSWLPPTASFPSPTF